MSENNVLSINSLDNNTVSAAVQSWTGLMTTTAGNTATITNNYPYTQAYAPYLSMGYTWLSYGTDKVLVTKAENGFVLSYNGKVFIAKNEKEVSKLIVKMMSPNKPNKEK